MLKVLNEDIDGDGLDKEQNHGCWASRGGRSRQHVFGHVVGRGMLREVAGGSAQSQYVGVEAQVSTRTLSIAQWIETPIKIKLPFHKRALYPVHEEFEAGKLDRR